MPTEPQAVERRFFNALVSGDTSELATLLTDDFVLIDVVRGYEVPRAVLLDAIAKHRLTFDHIQVVERRERRYGETAIIIGRTSLFGRAGDRLWLASSRYTHVFVLQDGHWRLASAQGTQIQ